MKKELKARNAKAILKEADPKTHPVVLTGRKKKIL